MFKNIVILTLLILVSSWFIKDKGASLAKCRLKYDNPEKVLLCMRSYGFQFEYKLTPENEKNSKVNCWMNESFGGAPLPIIPFSQIEECYKPISIIDIFNDYK